MYMISFVRILCNWVPPFVLPFLKVLCGYCKKEDPEEEDGAETVQWIQCDACDNCFLMFVH